MNYTNRTQVRLEFYFDFSIYPCCSMDLQSDLVEM
jgi:hypothetical protein